MECESGRRKYTTDIATVIIVSISGCIVQRRIGFMYGTIYIHAYRMASGTHLSPLATPSVIRSVGLKTI